MIFKLKDLVVAVETAVYEDSVQKIAGMSEEDRNRFADNLVLKIKADEKRKAEQEAIRLKEIQAQQAILSESQSTTKFFWNNSKIKTEGLESFRKQWGSRENEDDWRRSEKIAVASFVVLESDTSDVVIEEPKEDSLTSESLLANLPITDSLGGFIHIHCADDEKVFGQRQLIRHRCLTSFQACNRAMQAQC